MDPAESRRNQPRNGPPIRLTLNDLSPYKNIGRNGRAEAQRYDRWYSATVVLVAQTSRSALSDH